jgi:hypothetical protein
MATAVMTAPTGLGNVASLRGGGDSVIGGGIFNNQLRRCLDALTIAGGNNNNSHRLKSDMGVLDRLCKARTNCPR